MRIHLQTNVFDQYIDWISQVNDSGGWTGHDDLNSGTHGVTESLFWVEVSRDEDSILIQYHRQ